jgi:hypothetical protein
LKSIVLRTDATPQRVVPTKASTRVPAETGTPSDLYTAPVNCASTGAAPAGDDEEYVGAKVAAEPLSGHGSEFVL